MKNYEKYADEIRKYKGNSICTDFVMPNILKSEGCGGMACGACYMLQMIWLLEDYEEPEEPEVDWSRVEVDTPILVKQGENGTWIKRHFAKYKNGIIYTWKDGHTSWTEDSMTGWKYAKRVEDYEEPKEEPKIDWNKVEVDTPVLVKDRKNEEWKKRHFAKYEHGRIYVWNNGSTSWSACRMYDYKYAKLPEDEKKCEEPEVDWSKVKVDTPILVRDSEDNKWLERYFAKYEDGLVYAWLGENTSYDTCGAAKWKYAKLAESEENI